MRFINYCSGFQGKQFLDDDYWWDFFYGLKPNKTHDIYIRFTSSPKGYKSPQIVVLKYSLILYEDPEHDQDYSGIEMLESLRDAITLKLLKLGFNITEDNV